MSGQSSELPIPRALLEKYFGEDPRLLHAFESQSQVVADHADIISNNVAATSALQDASFVTLSPNSSLTNEYVLTPGDGTNLDLTNGVKIDVDGTVVRAASGPVSLLATGPVSLSLPVKGTLLSDSVPPKLGGLQNAASDSAAASLGVPIGGVYHNAGALRIRLT